jgi:hypothetical protein
MKNNGIVMKLIYRTKIHRPNKYERFHNEYYQKGDIIEKHTISSTRVPGRLEKGETRRNDCKYLSASWHIQDPNMPQWLKQYIVNTSETHTEDLINELQKDGYRVHACDDEPLLIFKDKIVKVFIDQVWIDIIPLIKLYYNRKKVSDKLLEQFEKDWLDLNVSYQQLLDKQEEANLLKKNEKYDKFYQKYYESYDSEKAAGELNRFLLGIISNTKGTEKEYFSQLLEKVQKQDLTPELYADTFAKIFTRERSKIR